MPKPNWIRARFYADLEDYRPIKWPPPGPYWCSGEGDDHSIVVAYVRDIKQVHEFWPEAREITTQEEDKITYSDRFAKPKWYHGPTI